MKKEIDADEQEAFIREVTEEVKNDNLKQMWEKYGIYIILLVVLEAMKMENEILAPHDGTVAQVIVSKGSTVETDSPLIVLA